MHQNNMVCLLTPICYELILQPALVLVCPCLENAWLLLLACTITAAVFKQIHKPDVNSSAFGSVSSK